MAEPVQGMITWPSCEGGGWAGVMHVWLSALERLSASWLAWAGLTAALEAGIAWDGPALLSAAGVAWCCRK